VAQRPFLVARRLYADKKAPSDHEPLESPNRPPHQAEKDPILADQIREAEVDVAPSEEAPAVGTPVNQTPVEEESQEGKKSDGESQDLSSEVEAPSTTEESTVFGDIPEASETARNSILDLFGPETVEKKKPTQSTTPVDTPKYNPLSAHDLDEGSIDLSAWQESQQAQKQKLEAELNPDEWADTRRGVWETEDVKNHSTPEQPVETLPLHDEIREQFLHLPKPKPKQIPFDLPLPEAPPASGSDWDYFYPPARPPRSLESIELRQQLAKKKPTEEVYDPFAEKKKTIKWPFFYNRDQLVDVCTNHIMKDGKKARADKIMQEMFLILLEKYPRKHPVTLFAEALDKNAPLFKHLNATKGAKAIPVPWPLNERQRIRRAWHAMIKPAGKRGPPAPFAEKLANEVIKAYEERSGGAQLRLNEHKKAMASRMNVKLPKHKVN